MTAETVKVAGVTFQNRQKTLMGIRTNLRNKVPTTMLLVREPRNQYDRNAIKVLARWQRDDMTRRAQVGYIPKETAKKLAPLMDRKVFIKIKDYEISDTKTVGVMLHLEWNPEK